MQRTTSQCAQVVGPPGGCSGPPAIQSVTGAPWSAKRRGGNSSRAGSSGKITTSGRARTPSAAVSVGFEVDSSRVRTRCASAVPLHSAVAVRGVEHLEGASREVERGDAQVSPRSRCRRNGGLPGLRVGSLRLVGDRKRSMSNGDGTVQDSPCRTSRSVAALAPLSGNSEVCHAQLARKVAQGAGTQQFVTAALTCEVAVCCDHASLTPACRRRRSICRALAGQGHRLLHQRVDTGGRAGEHDVEPVVGGGRATRAKSRRPISSMARTSYRCGPKRTAVGIRAPPARKCRSTPPSRTGGCRRPCARAQCLRTRSIQISNHPPCNLAPGLQPPRLFGSPLLPPQSTPAIAKSARTDLATCAKILQKIGRRG